MGSEKENTIKGSREAWVDVLNVVACMGVLLLHCTNHEIHGFSGEISFDWLLGLVTHSTMLWPVDVFFMLSGYTLIRRNVSVEMGGGNRLLFQKNQEAFGSCAVLEYGVYAPVHVWKVG